MKKVLFIASLPTKKVHFNGETNKSGDIYKILKNRGKCRINKINLTHFKVCSVIKMIFLSMFKKYDTIFVAKCAVGGSFAIHLLLLFAKKHNRNNIVFYWIGNGIVGFENKKIYLGDIGKCRCVIFESNQVLESCGANIKSFIILPCIKPNYDLAFKEKDYSKTKVLKCIYFSRICKEKGLFDAIRAIELANTKLGQKCLTLDIAGAPTTSEAEAFEKEVLLYLSGKEDVFTYYGKKFHVAGIETYKRLQEYDLHIFASRFKQECVPGSIVDMFIAGVPTISSSFPNVLNLLSEQDSFFYEQESYEKLANELITIYKNKKDLNLKRKNSYLLKFKYDEEHFLEQMKTIHVI